MDIVRMHYRRPDIQAEVLLDKPCIGIESPETSGAQGEVPSICIVRMYLVLDFLDGPCCHMILCQKRSVELFAVCRPVLVIIACTFAFGAALLLRPVHKRALSHCDMDMAFDQLDQFRRQLVHMATSASPIAIAQAKSRGYIQRLYISS